MQSSKLCLPLPQSSLFFFFLRGALVSSVCVHVCVFVHITFKMRNKEEEEALSAKPALKVQRILSFAQGSEGFLQLFPLLWVSWVSLWARHDCWTLLLRYWGLRHVCLMPIGTSGSGFPSVLKLFLPFGEISALQTLQPPFPLCFLLPAGLPSLLTWRNPLPFPTFDPRDSDACFTFPVHLLLA